MGRVNWRPIAGALDWAVPLGFATGLCLLAPLRTALEFGGDEGYELMKAFLVSRGYPLYQEVWNDQPPLHTELLALLFRIFGTSAYVGRLMNVGFAAVLVGALYQMVRHRSGRVGGLVAVGLLVSSSFFLQLSASVMIELPALALALASVWAWSNYVFGKGKHWLIFSGVLFGCALQVKLTAVIFLPALAMECLLRRIHRARKPGSLQGRTSWGLSREAAVWSAAAVAAFGVIAAAYYRWEDVSMIWSSHFSEATRSAVASEGYAFRPASLLTDLALLAPATLGVVLVVWKRRWDLLFPVTLLATAFGIHLWHRPYWYYYGAHFAIPLAWLGGFGIVEWFRAIWKPGIGASTAAKLRGGIQWLGWSAVVSLVVTLAPEKIWSESTRLGASPKAGEDPYVVELRKHAGQTYWVFTDRVIYAFWAGLPVPPEVAVVPAKRIWSGQIRESDVLACLKRYRTDQLLLLSHWRDDAILSDYIRAHFDRNPVGGELFIRKSSN
jgi:4-amino-4-deoxy-L-arabinose transferase-like glycosyltransferase